MYWFYTDSNLHDDYQRFGCHFSVMKDVVKILGLVWLRRDGGRDFEKLVILNQSDRKIVKFCVKSEINFS